MCRHKMQEKNRNKGVSITRDWPQNEGVGICRNCLLTKGILVDRRDSLDTKVKKMPWRMKLSRLDGVAATKPCTGGS